MDFSQYRKALVYVLTFLAYAWSGYGAGLLSNLKDAVLAAESVFQDLFENAITVARKIKDIHEVFDAAVEENCIFQCPGGVTPKPDWNHKPQSNGCGSLGIEINQEYLPLTEMTKCCDAHDICYDTCNLDKEKCDLEFKRCLYKYCDGYQSAAIINTCKAAAKMLFTGTTALGCKSYMDAQKNACYCGDKWNKKPKKAAQAGGELESMLQVDNVTSISLFTRSFWKKLSSNAAYDKNLLNNCDRVAKRMGNTGSAHSSKRKGRKRESGDR